MTKTKKKITISIGIPVYNEAGNIANLLNSILNQKNDRYLLKRIYVINDGSTDQTKAIVSEMSRKYPIVKFLDDHEQLGKNKRLDQFYKLPKTDLTIIFDGDIVLANDSTIAELIKPFKNQKVVLVGANKSPVELQNFVGKLINTFDHIWYETRIGLSKKDNIYNLSGCAFAVKTSFTKKLAPRIGLLSECQFLFLNAKQHKLQVEFAKEARILYRNPDNMHDYLLQSGRSEDAQQLSSQNWESASSEYQVPLSNKIKGILKVFARNPLLTFSSTLFVLTVRYLPKRIDPLVKNGRWEIIQSSKKPINI